MYTLKAGSYPLCSKGRVQTVSQQRVNSCILLTYLDMSVDWHAVNVGWVRAVTVFLIQPQGQIPCLPASRSFQSRTHSCRGRERRGDCQVSLLRVTRLIDKKPTQACCFRRVLLLEQALTTLTQKFLLIWKVTFRIIRPTGRPFFASFHKRSARQKPLHATGWIWLL